MRTITIIGAMTGGLMTTPTRAQSVTAPDAATLTAMALWAVLTVFALALASARRESARVQAIVY